MKETLDELALVMEQKNRVFLNSRKFLIEHKKEGDDVTVTVTLKSSDESFYYPVHLCVEKHLDHEMDEEQTVVFLVDYADLYFSDFFEEGENLFLPLEWAELAYDSVPIKIKGQIQNRRLEAEADKLLDTNNLH